jgi:phage gp36-like protein
MEVSEYMLDKTDKSIKRLLWVSIFLFICLIPTYLTNPLSYLPSYSKNQVFLDSEKISKLNAQKIILEKTLALEPDLKTVGDIEDYLDTPSGEYETIKKDLNDEYKKYFVELKSDTFLRTFMSIRAENHRNLIARYYLDTIKQLINDSRREIDEVKGKEKLERGGKIEDPLFGIGINLTDLTYILIILWPYCFFESLWYLMIGQDEESIKQHFGDNFNLWIPDWGEHSCLVFFFLSFKMFFATIIVLLPIFWNYYEYFQYGI